MADTFGERLQKLRNAHSWTVYEAAKRSGMAPWVLTRLEQRRALGNVQVRLLRRLAELYGVTVDYLIQGVPEDENASSTTAAHGGRQRTSVQLVV